MPESPQRRLSDVRNGLCINPQHKHGADGVCLGPNGFVAYFQEGLCDVCEQDLVCLKIDGPDVAVNICEPCIQEARRGAS